MQETERIFYEPEQFPVRPIGPVQISGSNQTLSGRTRLVDDIIVWLWCHPGTKSDIEACLKQNPRHAASFSGGSVSGDVFIEDATSNVSRLRLVGSKSGAILQKALHCNLGKYERQNSPSGGDESKEVERGETYPSQPGQEGDKLKPKMGQTVLACFIRDPRQIPLWSHWKSAAPIAVNELTLEMDQQGMARAAATKFKCPLTGKLWTVEKWHSEVKDSSIIGTSQAVEKFSEEALSVMVEKMLQLTIPRAVFSGSVESQNLSKSQKRKHSRALRNKELWDRVHSQAQLFDRKARMTAPREVISRILDEVHTPPAEATLNALVHIASHATHPRDTILEEDDPRVADPRVLAAQSFALETPHPVPIVLVRLSPGSLKEIPHLQSKPRSSNPRKKSRGLEGWDIIVPRAWSSAVWKALWLAGASVVSNEYRRCLD